MLIAPHHVDLAMRSAVGSVSKLMMVVVFWVGVGQLKAVLVRWGCFGQVVQFWTVRPMFIAGWSDGQCVLVSCWLCWPFFFICVGD